MSKRLRGDLKVVRENFYFAFQASYYYCAYRFTMKKPSALI
jgi:hypothetical protein